MSTTPMSDDVESEVSKTISGAEDMLTQAATATTERAAELRAKAQEQLKALRVKMQDAQDKAIAQSKAAARYTDDYVHDNPWRSIGIAAGVGVLIGMLIAPRRY